MKLIDRPPVILESYEQVDELYDWYDQHEPSRPLTRFGHALFSHIFPMDIQIQQKDEDSIVSLLENGTSLFLLPNHRNFLDQYLLASLAEDYEPFHDLRGRTKILAKGPLFNPPLRRYGVDEMGSIPVIRMKDIAKPGEVVSEEKRALQQHGVKRANQTMAKNLDRGNHGVSYTEGERKEASDPRVVQDLKNGIWDIYTELDPHTNIAFVPLGAAYPRNEAAKKTGSKLDRTKDIGRFILANRHPVLAIGEPIVQRFEDADEMLSAFRRGMQLAVDHAFAVADAKA